jgi:L-galactose dehydrogenase
MIYELGGTGLKTSVIGIGAGGPSRLGLAYGRSRENALALLRAGLERGINFFDSAPTYGTEDIIGEAVKDCRSKVILSTKAALGPHFGPFDNSRFASRISARIGEDTSFVLSAPALERRVNGSLRRLNTDYIDVLHLHTVTPGQYAHALDRLVPTLNRLKENGKIRYIGITEAFGRDRNHLMLTRAIGDGAFDCIMIGFNCLYQAGAPIAAEAKRRGIGVIGMYAVRGLVSKENVQSHMNKLVSRGLLNRAEANAEMLVRMLNEHGVATLPEAAIRFARHELTSDVILTGTGNIRHLEASIAASEAGPLPDSIITKMRGLFSD